MGQGPQCADVRFECRVLVAVDHRRDGLCEPQTPSLLSEVHIVVDLARPGVDDVSFVAGPSTRIVDHVAGDRELLEGPLIGPLDFLGGKNQRIGPLAIVVCKGEPLALT